MKTKYIKIPVTDRLPKNVAWYYTAGVDGSKMKTYYDGRRFRETTATPLYWLEEVPDREAEAMQIMKDVVFHFQQFQEGYKSIPQRQTMDKVMEFIKSKS